MSASYFGTFPVKREVSRSFDADGIITASMLIVDREADIASSAPSIDDAYELDGNLLVTQVNITRSGNGLAEAVVAASGPPLNPTARVSVKVGGPLIYGLASGTAIPLGLPLQHHPTNGQIVEVYFAASRGQENEIYEQYFGLPMPREVLGASLPRPAAEARTLTQDDNLAPFPPSILPPGFLPMLPFPATSTVQGAYRGFVCRDISFEPRGSALAVVLFFRETGQLIIETNEIFNY